MAGAEGETLDREPQLNAAIGEDDACLTKDMAMEMKINGQGNLPLRGKEKYEVNYYFRHLLKRLKGTDQVDDQELNEQQSRK